MNPLATGSPLLTQTHHGDLNNILVATGFIPARLRSSRHLLTCGGPVETVLAGFGAALQPNGDESPRHRESIARTDTSWGFEQHPCGEGIYPRSAAQQAQLAHMRCACRNCGGRFWGRFAAQRG